MRKNFADMFPVNNPTTTRWARQWGVGLKSIGPNEPLIEISGVNAFFKGCLIERGNINKIPNSELSSPAPIPGVAANSSFNFGLGGVAAYSFGVSGSDQTCAFDGMDAHTSWTFSMFVQMGDGTAPKVGTGAADEDFFIMIGWLRCPLDSTVVEHVSGYIYRVSGYAVSTSGAGTACCGFVKRPGGKTMLCSGFQLEPYCYRPSSYIRTAGAAVSRPSTYAQTTTDGWLQKSGGTFIIEFTDIINYDGVDQGLFTLWNQNWGPAGGLQAAVQIGTGKIVVFGGNRDQSAGDYIMLTPNGINRGVNAVNRVAVRYTPKFYGFPDISVCLNGGAVTSMANGCPPGSSMTHFLLGCGSGNPGWLNGHIRDLSYVPVMLTDQELQDVTRIV